MTKKQFNNVKNILRRVSKKEYLSMHEYHILNNFLSEVEEKIVEKEEVKEEIKEECACGKHNEEWCLDNCPN